MARGRVMGACQLAWRRCLGLSMRILEAALIAYVVFCWITIGVAISLAVGLYWCVDAAVSLVRRKKIT